MILMIVASYVLGAIPNGLIFGKLIWQIDLRRVGSGNIGATNAWRSIGKKAGVLIFVLDFLKGAVAVELARLMIGNEITEVVCGISAIIGHSASVFMGMKGGKGVATGLGVLTMMMPQVSVIAFLTWLAIVKVTRYVSLGSIVSAWVAVMSAYMLNMTQEYVVFMVLASVLITVRHASNVKRLLAGKENKV